MNHLSLFHALIHWSLYLQNPNTWHFGIKFIHWSKCAIINGFTNFKGFRSYPLIWYQNSHEKNTNKTLPFIYLLFYFFVCSKVQIINEWLFGYVMINTVVKFIDQWNESKLSFQYFTMTLVLSINLDPSFQKKWVNFPRALKSLKIGTHLHY